jgi:hypothetical protein
METQWKTIKKELLALLATSEARGRFKDLRTEVPALRQWSAPRFVASFLARRTPPLAQRKDVLRTLLSYLVEGGPRAELAAAILLLAGTLVVRRLRRVKDGGTPPAAPFVLIISHPLSKLADCWPRTSTSWSRSTAVHVASKGVA